MKILRESFINVGADVVLVRQQAKRIAQLLGLQSQDQTRLATAVSEAAREVLSCGCTARVEFVLDEQHAPPFLILRLHVSRGVLAGTISSIAGVRFPAPTSEGMIAARRLVDYFNFASHEDKGVTVELGKRAPFKTRSQFRDEVDRALEELSRNAVVDPNAVLNDQNRELVASLEELQDKQQELQRLNQELQDTNRGVVALYAELEEKAEQLHAASEAKSRFLTNVSHEFRTPLNSILALSRLLLDRVDGDLASEQEKQVVFIRRSAETLLEFVNDLLDLAKVEAGKTDLHLSEFSIRDLFGGLRGVLKPLQVSDMVELIFEDCDPISIYSDEGKVGQILRNLISNALKYTDRGEVQVSVSIDRAKGDVTFMVRDTGRGIPAEDQSRIFEEFEQVAGSFQQKNKGSGLGLALSRKFARLLRGDITLHSALGVGSRFCLTIPLDYRHPLGGVPPAPARDKKRVLIVDDEETFRYVVRHIMQSESGYELIEAADGAEGLLRARRDLPDAVILDLQMPVMGGQELLRELAADPRTREIPVIVSTSVTITAKLEQELSGAFRLLPKSALSREVLLSTLERSLSSEGNHEEVDHAH